jgi:ProQ/FINO family
MRPPAAGTAGSTQSKEMPQSNAAQNPRQDGTSKPPTVLIPSAGGGGARERRHRKIAGSAKVLTATLCERFPEVFDMARPRPLAIGISAAIRDAIGGLNCRVVGSCLNHWVNRWPYLKALAADGSAKG